MDLSLNDCTVKVINIYAPNSDRPEFFSQIKDLITSSETDHVIVCGDYNLALDPSLDTYRYKHINNPKSRELLLQLMNTCNMTDVFRYLHKETKRYTWRRKRPMQQAHLDYIIVSNGLLDYIHSCQIRPGYRTDHSIVEINMFFCKFTKGKGVWKFNCSLLKDSIYLELVNNLIDLVKKDYAVPVYNLDNIHQIGDTNLHIELNDSEFLEMLLLKIRGETIKYASNLKKGHEIREQQLISDIELLENSNISNNVAELEEKRIELQGLRENKVKGAYVR